VTRLPPPPKRSVRKGSVLSVALMVLPMFAAVVASLPSVAGAAEGIEPVEQTEQTQPSSHTTPGRLIVDHLSDDDQTVEGTIDLADDLGLNRRLGRSPQASMTAATVGELTACFESAVPSDVQETVRGALSSWSESLELTGPGVEIDVYWTPFSSDGALAAAGPQLFVSDRFLPHPTARYAVALANELLGVDAAPRATCDATKPGEIVVYINSTAGGDGSLWHVGDDTPRANSVDLGSVIAHELAHGFGFISSAAVDSGGTQRWPYDGGKPYVYDLLFSRCAAGDDCASEVSQKVTVADNATLTAGDLWIDAANAPMLEIYSPPTWRTGSSLSHFDEVRYPRGHHFAMLTPFIARGERHRSIDNAALTVMETIGWPISVAPGAPRDLVATPSNGEVRLSFTPPGLDEGPAPVAFELSIWRDGRFERAIEIKNRIIDLSGLVNGGRYQFAIRAVTATTSSESTPRSAVVVPLELPPFATAEAFTTTVFSQFLGRPPTKDELPAWSERARAASSLDSVVDDLLDDPMVVEQVRIVRLYLGFFNRQPDSDGLAFWIKRGREGETLERIALQFAVASEFERGSAVADSAFVTATYERVLGRGPDQGGLDYWVGKLRTGLDRGRLLLLFSESPEHLVASAADSEATIVAWSLLGRQPSTEERAVWKAEIHAGRRSQVIAEIMASDDYLTALG
jgi:hypothetical protein